VFFDILLCMMGNVVGHKTCLFLILKYSMRCIDLFSLMVLLIICINIVLISILFLWWKHFLSLQVSSRILSSHRNTKILFREHHIWCFIRLSWTWSDDHFVRKVLRRDEFCWWSDFEVSIRGIFFHIVNL